MVLLVIILEVIKFSERLKYEYLHSIFHKSNLSDNFIQNLISLKLTVELH